MTRRPPRSTLFPYTTLSRSWAGRAGSNWGRKPEPGRDPGERCVTVVLDGLPGEPVPADAQLVGDLPNAAKVDRESSSSGVEHAVGEVRAGGHAEHGERRTDGQTCRYAERVGNQLRREIRPLPQLQLARDEGDADPDFQFRCDLIADRRLDIDRLHAGVIAEKPSGEIVGVPFRFEPVRDEQPDPGGDFGG